jgi:insertion element IS1 protein InsB
LKHAKKAPMIHAVHYAILAQSPPQTFHVRIEKIDAAAMDELWRFVAPKGQQRWLWHAIDHHSGAVFADVLGTHQEGVFLQVKNL